MDSYLLQCKKITPSAFTGERICYFSYYSNENIEEAALPVPTHLVDENTNTIQLHGARISGDKAGIILAIGGSGEFENLIVDSRLLKLVA